ncbi:hypothetical protein [Shivajiella indica]|uniref:DUF5034 domain-containing protein n=1 Tax=Shivajiella indica TaxID=872115 RepID=A0ABW5B4Y6_9BACT
MAVQPSSFKFIIIILILTASFISCSSPNCSDTLYDVTSVELTPRTWDLSSNGNSPWDNSAGLPVTRLLVRIDMDKSYKSIPDLDSDCFPKFRIENKAKSIKIFSNQSFSSTLPAGQDLSSICAFTFNPGNFISTEDFLNSYFNESNFTTFYFVFNQNPQLEATHLIRMVVDFEDGSQLETLPIEVLIKPIETD